MDEDAEADGEQGSGGLRELPRCSVTEQSSQNEPEVRCRGVDELHAQGRRRGKSVPHRFDVGERTVIAVSTVWRSVAATWPCTAHAVERAKRQLTV